MIANVAGRAGRLPERIRPLIQFAKSKAGRRTILAVLAIAAIVGLTIGGAVGWLLWRLSDGPIDIASLQPRIEAAVAGELGDVSVSVGEALLDTDAEGDVIVRLGDVVVTDLEGNPLVRAPYAVVGMRLIGVAFGSMTPTSIELVGPHLHVRRAADGSVSLGFGVAPDVGPAATEASPPTATGEAAPPQGAGPGDGAAGQAPFLPVGVFRSGGALTTLKQLVVRQARLTVYDDASNSIWDSFNATLSIKRPGTGLAVAVDAPFSTDTGEWRLRLEVEQSTSDTPLEANATFDNVVPAEIAARIPSLADLAGFDMPVSGTVQASVSPAGVVDEVAIDLRAGAGFVHSLPFLNQAIDPVLLDESALTAVYSREKQRIDIESFVVGIGANRIDLSGAIAPQLDAAGGLVSAQFDLRAHSLRFAADDLAHAPAVVTRGLASGRLNTEPLTLELDTLALELPQGAVTLGGVAALAAPASVNLQGTLVDLPAAALVQLWPRPIAPGARQWIASHIAEGRISNAEIAVALDAEDMGRIDRGEPLGEEAIDIEFGFDGVTAHYLDPMPPIENGAGNAVLSGDRFVLSVREGSIRSPSGEPLAVTFGRFVVPTLAGDGYLEGQIDIGTSGPMRAALEVLDLEPLEFTRELGIAPAAVTGEATIIVGLALPLASDLQFRQIQIQAGATLAGIRVPGIFNSVTLESDELEILATQREITASGDLRLNGLPARAKLETRFDGAGGRSNRLSLNAQIGAEDLKRIGIDMTGFVTGTAPTRIEARGQGSRLDEISVEADVTAAAVNLPTIGWNKGAGDQASLALEIERLDNGQVRLRDIRLAGDGLAVEGAIRLDPDGSLYKVDLDRLQLGSIVDVAISGVRGDDGTLSVEVSGERFDAGTMLAREISGGAPVEPGEAARPVDIEFEIAEIGGVGDSGLGNGRGLVRLRDGKVQSLRLRGAFASRQALEVDYAQGSGSTPAVVTIDTGDAGAFVRFLGLYSRAFGGAMSVRARGADAKRLTGVISARGFQVRDEPLLLRIAAAQAGLPPGVARNVVFSKLNLSFERNAGVLDIRDALIAAPAVGATLRGRVDIAGEALDLSGTYIPAYSFNAMLGGVPLVGPLLSGRSGEGLFGTTFRVAGAMADPTITINPMSAIAPGPFRRLFEFRQQR